MKLLTVFAFFMAVCLTGCSRGRMLIYESEPAEDSYTFFSNGIPITVYQQDSSVIMFSASEDKLLGKACLKVWLLYTNNSDKTFLLEPYNLLYVEAKDGDDIKTFEPKSPAEILDALREQETISQVANTIGTALKVMSSEDKYEVKDAMHEHNVNRADISSLYNVYRGSINAGVLRKNTLFPGQSINGYMYFQLTGVTNSNDAGYVSPYMDELDFTLYLKTGKETKQFKLKPSKVW
jgi:hypothetical protein